MDTIIPARGERALVCGQTGSGKTVAMAAIARALSEENRVLIIDCKIEPRYRRLPRAKLSRDLSQTWAAETRQEKRLGPVVHIWRPPLDIAQVPAELDDAIYSIYSKFRGSVVIDELYPLHSGGRAGPGLTALVTRGRSRGITTIMGSQRPAWISRFCLSEAQHYWVYPLVDRQDRRRLSEVVPEFPVETVPPRYHFLYYANNTDMPGPVLFSPLQVTAHAIDDEADDAGLTRELRWI